MKIEQLRQVLEIYQSGSINKAANNLYISQPSISNSLKSLEQELNQKIFIRTFSGVQLTKFGESFIKNAIPILKHADEIQLSARNFTFGKPPLSFSVSVNYLLFAYHIFQYLIKKYESSSTNFRYNQVSVSDVIYDVSTGATELGLVSIPTIDKEKWLIFVASKDLDYKCIYSSSPSAMVSKTHKNFDKLESPIRLSNLSHKSLIVIGEKLPLLNSINHKMCQILGAKNVIEVNDRTTAHEFIQHGESFSCVVHCEKAYTNVDFFSYAKNLHLNDVSFDFEIGWLQKTTMPHSQIAKEFINHIEDLLK